MSSFEGLALVATICNTIGAASPYALWYSDGKRQCVLDLSDYVRGPGGLTGITYHSNRIYVAVQAAPSRILVLDMGLNVVDVIVNENFNDLHSIQIVDSALYIVSSRNGNLLKRDLTNGHTKVVADLDPKAWVCGVHCRSDDIWLCCHHLSY